jgi:hypothetical protein
VQAIWGQHGDSTGLFQRTESAAAVALISAWLVSGTRHVPRIGRWLPRLPHQRVGVLRYHMASDLLLGCHARRSSPLLFRRGFGRCLATRDLRQQLVFGVIIYSSAPPCTTAKRSIVLDKASRPG